MGNSRFDLAAFVACATFSGGKNGRPNHTSNKRPDHRRRLQSVLDVLQQWRHETNSTSERMPTDIQLRACPTAERLRLRSLILNAGGYHKVSTQLNIPPSRSHRDLARDRKLMELAAELYRVCKRKGHPSPFDDFPSRKTIRSLSPSLANKIEALPSRTGYLSLSNFIQNQWSPAATTSSDTLERRSSYRDDKKAWGKWTDINFILNHIAPYQVHPRVMPLLRQLPPSAIQAVHRKGGSFAFAVKAKLVLYKSYHNIQLWSSLVRWLASEAISRSATSVPTVNPKMYENFVIDQSQHPPSFPPTETIRRAGFFSHVTRFGGRRVLALRLGFSPKGGMAGLVMSNFSVQFAADILEYALMKAIPASDGSIAMPTRRDLEEDNMHHLAAAVEIFHGEAVVGRRVGLVFELPSTW